MSIENIAFSTQNSGMISPQNARKSFMDSKTTFLQNIDSSKTPRNLNNIDPKTPRNINLSIRLDP